jgi:predicted DNA-binding protein with PD1-like motif
MQNKIVRERQKIAGAWWSYFSERQQAPTMPSTEINKMTDPKDITSTSGSVSTEDEPPVHKKVEVGEDIRIVVA